MYNLKAVLSKDELIAFYRMAQYEKLSLLLIEDCLRERQPEYEKIIVVDKDLCVF